MSARFPVASDIGGTFTDIATVTPDGTLFVEKVPSTPEDLAAGVVDGIVRLAGARGLDRGSVSEVFHACTVATNAILEHRGARTGLVTTEGFRDVLELRRIRVPRLYEPLYQRPAPLVPRALRLEVRERIGGDGAVVVPLDEESVVRAARALAQAQVTSVAVGFLNAYRNDAHERRAGEIVREILGPDVFVCLSSEVLPLIREYERISTTVANAYVGPPVSRYLDGIVERLGAAGFDARLSVMESAGGLLDVASVRARPAGIVESGPAAGIVGAAHLARTLGLKDVVTFDMGGTTAKASIVKDGRIPHADGYEVGGEISATSALGGGGGYALSLPVIDISEIGAGGGSLVHVDAGGLIKVGPESAGAVPGPASYGKGNERPTVTDANVVLGYVNPRGLAGGTVPIHANRAEAALRRFVAEPLGVSVVEAALGVHRIANARMLRAIRSVTTQRGLDPRDFALVAFGGNGGVHGAGLAAELGMTRMIVPRAAGVFSAVGLLFAPKETTALAAFPHDLDAFPAEAAEAAARALKEKVAGLLAEPVEALRFEVSADMRYRGQAFELSVRVPGDAFGPDTAAALAPAFDAVHAERYGHAFPAGTGMEVVALRVTGIAAARPPELAGADRGTPPPPGTRTVHFAGGAAQAPVLDRAHLSEAPRAGPLVVEEYDGTTVVPPGATVAVDGAGNLVLALAEEATR